MMLVANSCLISLIDACVCLSLSIFTLTNDLKQIVYQDSLCVFRGYMGATLGAVGFYSYLLQAVYRYIIVIHPKRRLQS